MENIAEKQTQKRLLKLAITDPKFYNRTKNNQVNYFEGSEHYQDIYRALNDFRKDNKLDVPTKDTLDTFIQEKLDRKKVPEDERVPIANTLSDVYKTSEEDLDLNRNKVLEYVKRQLMFEALRKVAANELNPASLENFDKDYERIKKDTSTANASDVIDFFDIDNKELVVESIDAVTGNVVSTGSEFFDDLTDGGLAKGEMGAIIAPSGYGKTLNMVSLSTSYLLAGYDVMYVALEELTGRMVLRVAKSILGAIHAKVPELLPAEILNQMTFDENIEKTLASGMYHKTIERYEEQTGEKVGKFNFTRYSPHTIGLDDLRQVVSDTVITEGRNIDVLFVDYPDLLRAPGAMENEAITGGYIYEGVRAIGQDFNVVTWVASQVNRNAGQQDIIDRSSIEGSFRKLNALEFAGFIQKSAVERENNLTRIYVDKSRNGEAQRMVYGKVGRFTKFIEAETDAEKVVHDSLLGGKDNEPGYASNLAEFTKEQNSGAGEAALKFNRQMKERK